MTIKSQILIEIYYSFLQRIIKLKKKYKFIFITKLQETFVLHQTNNYNIKTSRRKSPFFFRSTFI